MTVLEHQPPAGGFVKFMLVGLAVSVSTWLATISVVAFILVPDNVRDTVLRGTSVRQPTVMNATRIDHPASRPLPA